MLFNERGFYDERGDVPAWRDISIETDPTQPIHTELFLPNYSDARFKPIGKFYPVFVNEAEGFSVQEDGVLILHPERAADGIFSDHLLGQFGSQLTEAHQQAHDEGFENRFTPIHQERVMQILFADDSIVLAGIHTGVQPQSWDPFQVFGIAR